MVNNRVCKWLSELGEEFHFSVANRRHILVLKVSHNTPHLYLYDEDANLVGSVSAFQRLQDSIPCHSETQWRIHRKSQITGGQQYVCQFSQH